MLDSLIQRSLIRQEIERLGIDVTDVDVDRAIDDVAARNQLDRDTLRAEVEKSGMSWSQYRDELREGLRQQQFTGYIVQTRISVDEDELRDMYRRMLAEKPAQQVVELGAFLLPWPEGADGAAQQAVFEAARAAAARVAGGQAFAEVAAEVDPANFGARGGVMGSYKQGELVAQLDGPAFATPVGQCSEPVVTDRGVFVLYPFSRQEVPPPSFEEMKDELQNRLYSDRIEDETEQWVQAARRQAAVQVKLESAPTLGP
ncbi:SurA N-terminal domain-containing protein [Myxococcota bacterium]|nr:SurA N-terminal domain-containing protein [Myxococcota bacterium]